MIDIFLKQRKKIEELLLKLYNDTENPSLAKAKEEIEKDLEFLYKNDPSISHCSHARYFASAFAVAAYRIAHTLQDSNTARQITEYAKSVTGVDIHPRAKIGVPFCIDHGVGTVIGETAVIGDGCMLYHGVTLGAKHLKERQQEGLDRHPKLGNNVIIYSNTTILGNLQIPSGMIIGANKFIKKQEEIEEILEKRKKRG